MQSLVAKRAVKLLSELPLILFVAFNGVMLWLVWDLKRDLARLRQADGASLLVPSTTDVTHSANILQGLPVFWAVGAIAIGLLAAYWHAVNARRNPEAGSGVAVQR